MMEAFSILKDRDLRSHLDILNRPTWAKRLSRCIVNLTSALFFLNVPTASAAVIDVLWLSGSNTYNANIAQLGSGGARDAVSYDPDGDGSNSWNIDFWSSGVPTFNNYDALVIGSTCIPACGGINGFFNLGVHPDLVLNNKTAISDARGDRTFVSGQDADWHYYVDSSATDRNDARAFLINAVNWAASGSGLGIVALTDGYDPANPGQQGWLDHIDSFLKDEIGNARSFHQSNDVIIPPDSATFPINEGLTTARLSGWGTSSHTAFDKSLLPGGWKAINDAHTVGNDLAVTIVTASQAGGGTIPTPVPEPGILALFIPGLLMFVLGRIRRKNIAQE